MKIKTSELEGRALDWATGVAVKGPDCVIFEDDGLHVSAHSYHEKTTSGYWHGWMPSTQWSQGGPILDQLIASGFEVAPSYPDCFACSNHTDEGLPYSGDWDAPEIRERGDTILIAACRAMVAQKLGEAVEIPEPLVPA